MTIATAADYADIRTLWNTHFADRDQGGARPRQMTAVPPDWIIFIERATLPPRGLQAAIFTNALASPRTGEVGCHLDMWMADLSLSPLVALRAARRVIKEAARHYHDVLGYRIGWGVVYDTPRIRNLLDGYGRLYTYPDFTLIGTDPAALVPDGRFLYYEGGAEIFPVLDSTT